MDRRGFLIGLGAAAAAAVATPAAAQTLFVTTNGLNVRVGPGTNFRVLTTIGRGTAVVVLRRSGGWVRVRLPGGAVGWVSASYLAARRPGPGTPGPVRGRVLIVSAPDRFLALRAGPRVNAPIIRQMRNGTSVTLLGQEQGAWVRVRHQSGDVGWAFRPHLNFR